MTTRHEGDPSDIPKWLRNFFGGLGTLFRWLRKSTRIFFGGLGKSTGGRGFVLLVEILYLLVLLAIGLSYATDPKKPLLGFTLPNSFGSLPVGVPWFGALGAVMISLSAIFDHRNDWEISQKYWHFARPLVGSVLAIISVLIFQSGVLAVGSTPTPKSPQDLLYYLVAFVVGYREETFRELIKRLTDVILTPGGGAPPPVIEALNPSMAGAGGGDSVAIRGSGFTNVTSVKFGPNPARYQVDSSGQITATTPPAPGGKPGTVSITVTTKTGSTTGGQFTYW